MKAFIEEFGHILSQGGFAIWALIVLAILLYSTLARIALQLLQLRPLVERGELSEATRRHLNEARSQREVTHIFARLELDKLAFIQRRLPFAMILTGVAPLAGLLGTVSGMLVTFSGLAHSSAAKPIEKISAGVSEALITTQAGLVVAIPAAIVTAMLASQARKAEGSVQGMLHRRLAEIQSPS